jgi:hypothetical protein
VIERRARGQRPDEARETGPFFRPVGKRIGPGKILDIGFAEAGRSVVETNSAFEAKLRGPLCETGGRDMIAEDILCPGKVTRLGRDFETRIRVPSGRRRRADAASYGARQRRPVAYSDMS